MLSGITRSEPRLWSNSIVGFGTYHYKYDSGREVDWFLTGFSPRKQAPAIYIMAGFDDFHDIIEKIGKDKPGVPAFK